MSKFIDTLPAKSPRIELLLAAERNVDLSPERRCTINMFEDPLFANSSFMRRRAMHIKRFYETMPLQFFPHELIVGSCTGIQPRVIAETYEERKQWASMSLAFPARNTAYGTDDYVAENRSLSEEELHDDLGRGRWGWGHSCYGLEKILTVGYEGIIADAQKRMDDMQISGCVDMEKMDFWWAVVTSCRAVVNFANRYADATQKMADAETDPVRKQELYAAAMAVRHSPAYPARTFHEAVQGCWLSYMCNLPFNGTDMGRFDQVMYPFYKADLDAGRITPYQAQELLDNLWVKFHEMVINNPNHRGNHPSIMLAGVNAQGKDCTNDVTYMCMNATRHTVIPSPKLSVRINDQTPDELFELAHDMLSSGMMMPDFYNEPAVIDAYLRIGVPYEDAICFAQSVCEEISLAGISEECTNEGPHIDLHDMVMNALKKAEEDTPFEAILDQVDREIVDRVAYEVNWHNAQTKKLAYYLPSPLHSATILGCVESGKDIYAGGAKYNNTGSVLSGIATAANSLYTVKRLVYDEKRMTLCQLMDILAQDYEGNEMLRAEILSKFPKYGNDVQDVDQYAVRMFDVFERELGKYKNSRGGIFKLGAWASEFRSNYPATPDGRKRWDSFAVNISPTPGTDQKGATAVIRTTTKLGIRRCTAGGMVDVTLTPSCLKGENGVQVLKYLVNTYCMLGGCGLQFNFVDSAILESAQKDPLKYKNLMVRVWGYNDYFVALNAKMQQHIVDRTRHEESV